MPTQEDIDKGIGCWCATPEQKEAAEKVKEYLTGKGYTADSVDSLIDKSWGIAVGGIRMTSSGLVKAIMRNFCYSVAEESAKAPWSMA